MGEKSRPVIGKLMEALCYAGNDAFSSESVTSPRSPLDLMILLSPRARGLVKCDLGGTGIGLGIVAAMDKGGAIAKAAFGGNGMPKTGEGDEDDEDYTCVISHAHAGPNKTFSRRMYFHDDDIKKKRGQLVRQGQNNSISSKKHVVPSCTFYISQDGILDDGPPAPAAAAAAAASDSFLSSCGFCRKGLEGKDIYMYRGEIGYCSEECRESEIAMEVSEGCCCWH